MFPQALIGEKFVVLMTTFYIVVVQIIGISIAFCTSNAPRSS
jgi:hypothetical protein